MTSHMRWATPPLTDKQKGKLMLIGDAVNIVSDFFLHFFKIEHFLEMKICCNVINSVGSRFNDF